MSELEGLSFDPLLGFHLIGVQELVTEDVSAGVVGHQLSSTETSIGIWMRTWSVLVGVEQFQLNGLFLPSSLLGVSDEDRAVIVCNIDECL